MDLNSLVPRPFNPHTNIIHATYPLSIKKHLHAGEVWLQDYVDLNAYMHACNVASTYLGPSCPDGSNQAMITVFSSDFHLSVKSDGDMVSGLPMLKCSSHKQVVVMSNCNLLNVQYRVIVYWSHTVHIHCTGFHTGFFGGGEGRDFSHRKRLYWHLRQ